MKEVTVEAAGARCGEAAVVTATKAVATRAMAAAAKDTTE
jgi:hypothetical protein